MLSGRLQTTEGGFFYDACVCVPLLLHGLAATILSAAGMPTVELQQIMPDAVDLIPACYCFYRNSRLGGRNTNSPYFDLPVQATMIRSDQFKLNLYHTTNDEI